MILYLIKCTIAMGVSWIIFRLFLAQKKSFTFNRLYLLCAIIGSAITPLIGLPYFFKEIRITDSIYAFSEFNNGVAIGTSNNIEVVESLEISDLFSWITIAIIIILTVRFLYRIIALIRLSHRSYPHYKDGIRIAIIDDKRTPFSFFNVIYVDKSTYTTGIEDTLFFHEKYHIQKCHSVDRIIVELISIFLWMNPFLRLLKHELIDNHEYAADAYAISKTLDTQNYLSLILSNSIPNTKSNFLLQRFSHSSSIKRIKMITRIQNNDNVWFRLLACILLLGCLISCSDDLDDIRETENRIQSQTELNPTKSSNSTRKPIAWPSPERLFPINPPIERLLKKWTDKQTFGIWIDKEKVQNTVLINKPPNDFSHFVVSEVPNDSEDYGDFKYRVHLLTNEGYEAKLKEMQVRYEAYKKKHPELYTAIKNSRKSKTKEPKIELTKKGSQTPPPPPVPGIRRPSTELLQKWANNNQFKIEIDGKPINNSQLYQFNPTDFSLFKVGINEQSPANVRLKYENKVQLLTNKGYLTFKSRAEEMLKKYEGEFSTVLKYK